MLLHTTEFACKNFTLELILKRKLDDELIQAHLGLMSWIYVCNIDYLYKFLFRLNDVYQSTLFHYFCELFMHRKNFLATLTIEIIL